MYYVISLPKQKITPCAMVCVLFSLTLIVTLKCSPVTRKLVRLRAVMLVFACELKAGSLTQASDPVQSRKSPTIWYVGLAEWPSPPFLSHAQRSAYSAGSVPCIMSTT